MMDMKRYKKCWNENGLTLIEVLASVVLLTIIITIFLNVFIQSSKTNRTSEKVVDATYLAQTELERIYEVSMKTNYEEREDALHSLAYHISGSEDEWMIFNKDIGSDYYATLKLQKEPMEDSENMNRTILTIHKESIAEKHLVLMENIVVWGVDEE